MKTINAFLIFSFLWVTFFVQPVMSLSVLSPPTHLHEATEDHSPKVTYAAIFHDFATDLDLHIGSLNLAYQDALARGRKFVILLDSGVPTDLPGVQNGNPQELDRYLRSRSNLKKAREKFRRNYNESQKFATILNKRDQKFLSQMLHLRDTFHGPLIQWMFEHKHAQLVLENNHFENWLLNVKSMAYNYQADSLLVEGKKREAILAAEKSIQFGADYLRERNDRMVQLVQTHTRAGTDVFLLYGAHHFGVFESLLDKGLNVIKAPTSDVQDRSVNVWGNLDRISGRIAAGDEWDETNKPHRLLSGMAINFFEGVLTQLFELTDHMEVSNIAHNLFRQLSPAEIDMFIEYVRRHNTGQHTPVRMFSYIFYTLEAHHMFAEINLLFPPGIQKHIINLPIKREVYSLNRSH